MPTEKMPPFRVGGVVLAAGRSRRMGRDKALLDADGRAFIARAVTCLAAGGADPVVVVVRDARGDPATAARAAGAGVVVNPDPDHPAQGGPVSSVRRALAALRTAFDGHGVDGALVLPVDHPRVRAETVRHLIAAFAGEDRPVVVPAWQGRRGHPVLIGRAIFDELDDDGLAEGLRTVVRRHRSRRLIVPVDDPGVVDDLDTPADYRAVFEAEPLYVAEPGAQ